MTTSKIKYSESTILPNNFLAEQAVLNILLTNPSLIENCLSKLNTQCFYFEPHSIIFNAIFTLSENHKPINVTTVITFLQDKCLLESIGGLQRIINIVNRFENFSDLDEYIKLLKEKYVRRLMIESGKQIILWGYTTSKDTNIILNEIEQLIFNLNENTNADKIYNSAEIMDEVFQDMISKIKKDESLGLKNLRDRQYRGFKRDESLMFDMRDEFVANKAAFLAVINSFKNDFDNPKSHQEVVDYITSFFEIIEDDKQFKLQVLDEMRTK